MDKNDQSPINIILDNVKVDNALAPLELYSSTKLFVEQQANGHTWQVTMPTNESRAVDIAWRGKDFFLTQFHFHSPSENLFNGRHFDMEAHFVHEAEDGQILVLAVMLDAHDGHAPNRYLAEFWNGFPGNITDEFDKTIDSPYATQSGILPEDKSYYFYNGSLTTPLCNIDTDWVVLSTPVKISLGQRDSFRQGVSSIADNQLVVVSNTWNGVTLPWDSSIGVDVRPAQPLGNRTVWAPPPIPLSSVAAALAFARYILVVVVVLVSIMALMPVTD